jgi:hypothetical protein
MKSSSTFSGIFPTACVASQWKITPRSRHNRPISRIGWSVPISLFAAMIDTSTVSGRIASAT